MQNIDNNIFNKTGSIDVPKEDMKLTIIKKSIITTSQFLSKNMIQLLAIGLYAGLIAGKIYGTNLSIIEINHVRKIIFGLIANNITKSYKHNQVILLIPIFFVRFRGIRDANAGERNA